MTAAGFHEGERAVQRRAGTEHDAGRLSGMLDRPWLDGGFSRFLAARTFAVLSGRDAAGRLWASPLAGRAGMLDAHGTVLKVHAVPAAGDPLAGLPAGQPVGLIAIEFAIRRRVRINGTLERVTPNGLMIAVDQAYGNCPQYIQMRELRQVPAFGLGDPGAGPGPGDQALGGDAVRGELTEEDADQIRRSDTFFLGTAHPTRGADCSHRGGPMGLVRVAGNELWWPDYPGNKMFNSLGNLAVDPTAALLFAGFGSGRVLHLSGTAVTEWGTPGEPGDDGGTGRRVRFTPSAIQSGPPLPVRSRQVAPYQQNPPLT
jgi:uncharacterized protein